MQRMLSNGVVPESSGGSQKALDAMNTGQGVAMWFESAVAQLSPVMDACRSGVVWRAYRVARRAAQRNTVHPTRPITAMVTINSAITIK
jgi:hypothetical protein